ncbi:Hypothetical protein A7982_02861 [Minicystis rosea]|nr:Hypothetical protein A7982_02861 [Minicystis rosea]
MTAPRALTAEAGGSARPDAILAVLSLASFMASLDLFIVNVAFDEIGRDLKGATLSDLSWVLNAYAIAYAALLVPLGRLSDRFGRKAGFLLGLALFTGASAACAATSSLWALVAFRALKAAGAALLTPTSLALLLDATPAPDRARAVRIWAVTGSLAAAAGPVLGGVLVAISWRWVFLVNVPIGALALAGAAALVPPSRDPAPGAMPDLLGAMLAATSVGLLAYALVQAPERGFASGGVLASFATAAITAVAFARRSRRHPSPIVEPALLRVPSFAWANVAALLFNLAFAANLLLVILWLQRVWRMPSITAGFAIAPGPLMVPVFAAIAQRASRRGVSAGSIAAAGSALCGAGAALLLLRIGEAPAYATEVLPGWLVGGAGVGLAMPTILSAATIDLPRARSATGSAIVNMSRQIGAVLGVSLLIAIFGEPHGFTDTRAAFRRVWAAVLLTCAGAALASTRMGKSTANAAS